MKNGCSGTENLSKFCFRIPTVYSTGIYSAWLILYESYTFSTNMECWLDEIQFLKIKYSRIHITRDWNWFFQVTLDSVPKVPNSRQCWKIGTQSKKRGDKYFAPFQVMWQSHCDPVSNRNRFQQTKWIK